MFNNFPISISKCTAVIYEKFPTVPSFRAVCGPGRGKEGNKITLLLKTLDWISNGGSCGNISDLIIAHGAICSLCKQNGMVIFIMKLNNLDLSFERIGSHFMDQELEAWSHTYLITRCYGAQRRITSSLRSICTSNFPEPK